MVGEERTFWVCSTFASMSTALARDDERVEGGRSAGTGDGDGAAGSGTKTGGVSLGECGGDVVGGGLAVVDGGVIVCGNMVRIAVRVSECSPLRRPAVT